MQAVRPPAPQRANPPPHAEAVASGTPAGAGVAADADRGPACLEARESGHECIGVPITEINDASSWSSVGDEDPRETPVVIEQLLMPAEEEGEADDNGFGRHGDSENEVEVLEEPNLTARGCQRK